MSNTQIPGLVSTNETNPSHQGSHQVDPSANPYERVTQAQGYAQTLNPGVNLANAMYVSIAFDAFKYCTSDIPNLQNPNANQKRTLFLIGQQALQVLDHAAVIRLGINQATINYGSIENDPANLEIPDLYFTPDQNAWLTPVQDNYESIVTMDLAAPDSLPFIKRFVASVLDNTTKFLDNQQPNSVMKLLTMRSIAEDWRAIFYRHLIGVLLHLAKYLSQQFGDQSVELFGTKVPVTCFA